MAKGRGDGIAWMLPVLGWVMFAVAGSSLLLAAANPSLTAVGAALDLSLAPASPARAAHHPDMTPQQERRRFARLQRKGVLGIQRSGPHGVLRLTINPFVWYRLTSSQQTNFLQRAQRVFGGAQVEIRARRTNALLARLTATGQVEFASQRLTTQPPPTTP